MLTKTLIPAIAALGFPFVSAQNSEICSESEIAINAAAEVAQIAGCETVEGSVTIGTGVAGQVSINGPQRISGDLIVANNGGLTVLQSSSLESIGGTFRMQNATALNTVSMPELTRVQAIDWQSLTRLESLSFSSGGLSDADSIRISDTFLASLNAISVTSVRNMDINNNRRLDNWESGLATVSDTLIITANGFGLKVAFPDLVWIANMTVSNVSSITIPSLEVVNGSLRFDSNFFTAFSAPNMTQTEDGDLSFTDNGSLTNVSFPALTQVGGGFLIANNTELQTIDGFPELATVGGAVKLRGNFTEVNLPSLNDVKGAFDIASTDDIDDICAKFRELAPSNQNGNGVIQGEFTCRSADSSANDVNSEGGSSSNGGGDDSAAASLGFSLPVMLCIAALSGFAHVVM